MRLPASNAARANADRDDDEEPDEKNAKAFRDLAHQNRTSPRINSARQPAHNEPARCPRVTRTWEWVPRGFPWLKDRTPCFWNRAVFSFGMRLSFHFMRARTVNRLSS